MDSRMNVAALQTPADYQQGRQHLFPSAGSLQWYMRRKRDSLVSAGALLLIAGRWMVAPEVFDRVVLEAGQEDAQGSGK